MKPVLLAVAAVLFAFPSLAQAPSIQSTPLPPLQQQWQQEGSRPVQEAPAGNPPAAVAPPSGPKAPPPLQPAATMPAPNVWVPATAAKLSALDKVNAQSTALIVKVGESVTFGSLTITVKSCVIRPADQAADAAAFLDVTDSHPDAPPFSGWMLAAEPSVSMIQNPVYDVRVTGCS